ncbi:MAG: helix-turn-helix transcriptional regulator [Pseudomonadota bacterium]
MMRQVPRFQSELPTNRLGHLISQEWTHFLGRNPARAAEASMSNACSRGQDVVFNPRQVLAAVRSTGFTVVGIERMIDFGMQGGWAFPVVDYTSDTFDVISFDCRDQLTEQSALMESLGSSVKHAVAFFLEGLLLRDLEAELVQQPLSEREQEAINWVALGYRTKGVAEVMGIAQSTANEHLTAAMFKLHAATRPQAAARAGLLNLTS